MDAKMAKRIMIARRIAREFQDSDVVNLGIGLPTLVANYVAEGVTVISSRKTGAWALVGGGVLHAEADPRHLQCRGGSR